MLKYIKHFILILCLYNYIFISLANAAIINASSCSQADVSTAINSAYNGDTVIVPSGNCTWDTRVNLNKEINIIGAGIGNTIITDYGFGVDDGVDNWRISGFEFKQNTAGIQCFEIGASKSTDGCRNFRIDHIKFTGYYRMIWLEGHNTGVIDHCDFIGGGYARIMLFSGHDDTSWTEDTNLGTDDFVFVEDCTFDNDGVRVTHIIDGNRGAKYVFRYNTVIERSANTINDWITMHGYGHGSYDRGIRAYEVYENKFIRGYNGFGRAFQIRGGTGVIYNNIFDESTSSFTAYFFLRELRVTKNDAISLTCDSHCETNRWCPEGDGGEGYGCCDQIGRGKNQGSEPLYIWGNVDHNGNLKNTVTLESSVLENYIQENRDYFFSQKPGYTPYEYPHPLIYPERVINFRFK